MTVIHERVTTQFARRAGSGKGLDAADAIAAAEARMETLRDGVNDDVEVMVRDIVASRLAIGAVDATIERSVHARADALVGLCGLFGPSEIEAAAASLCQLFDGCHPERPDGPTVQVHIDAIQALWSLRPEDRSHCAPAILDGLRKVVEAGKCRSWGAAL